VLSLHIAVALKVRRFGLCSLFWCAGEICSSGFDIWIEENSAMELLRFYSGISKGLIVEQRSGCTSAPIHITIFNH
jgi:hypothetical protein